MADDFSKEHSGLASNRREFLSGATAVSIAASGSALAAQTEGRDTPIVNTLGSLFGRAPYQADSGAEPIIVESRPEMVTEAALRSTFESGVNAVNVTVGHVSGDTNPFELTVSDVGRWHRIFRQRQGQLLHVLSAADIQRAKDARKIGVILGFQNSTMFEDKAERVELFADLGVRVFQMTYNNAVRAGDGATATANRPLTEFGLEVVERINRAKVLCDLSHSGEQTCLSAIQASRAPVSISHTGCRALADLPRNKTDAELRLVANKGGYVGIYFMPFLRTTGIARAEDVVAHIEHAWNICGEDHVGVGTDTRPEEVGDLEEYLKGQREYVALRRRNGIAAPSESGDVPFFVVDLQGPTQFRKLDQLLRSRGHSTRRIEKLLGENFVRVAGEVWGA